jgi:hypothetical protein
MRHLLALLLLAQAPLQLLPKNYTLLYENYTLRILHVLYNRHQKLPTHNHSDRPTIYEFTITRQPEKAGTFRISPGRLEKHTVENLGDIPSEFLRIELKQIPLGFQRNSFRSPKIFDLSRAALSTEFSSPAFQIERIVSVGEPSAIPPDPSPALLIAFSEATVEIAGSPHPLQSGKVLWIPPGAPSRINYKDARSAYILRILLPQQPPH